MILTKLTNLININYERYLKKLLITDDYNIKNFITDAEEYRNIKRHQKTKSMNNNSIDKTNNKSDKNIDNIMLITLKILLELIIFILMLMIILFKNIYIFWK